jgi:hypothetical protein
MKRTRFIIFLIICLGKTMFYQDEITTKEKAIIRWGIMTFFSNLTRICLDKL